MPIPAYMIVCEGMSEDAHDHVLTAFRILEQVTFQRFSLPNQSKTEPNRQPVIFGVSWKILASWMRQDNDIDVPFDCEFRCVYGNNEERSLHIQTATIFPQNASGALARFAMNLSGMPEFLNVPGVAYFEHRIRHSPNGEWHTQRFPIICGQPAEVEIAQSELIPNT